MNTSIPENSIITPSIGTRVQLGRAGGKVTDGAIVPFPAGCSGKKILGRLRGSERKVVDRLESAGFQTSVYEYHSAEGEVIQAVLRFDHKSERKEIRPLLYYGKPLKDEPTNQKGPGVSASSGSSKL